MAAAVERACDGIVRAGYSILERALRCNEPDVIPSDLLTVEVLKEGRKGEERQSETAAASCLSSSTCPDDASLLNIRIHFKPAALRLAEAWAPGFGLPPSSVSSQLSRLSGQGPPPFTGSSAEEDEKEYLRLRRLLTLTSSAGEHVEGKKRQEEDADGEKTLARCSLNSCPSKDARMLCARCKRARYCSKECQKKDRPLHKKVCKAIARALG